MVFEKIKEIIVQELKLKVDKIEKSSRLQEDLGADSLDAVELIISIEDEFNISISDDEATDIKTIGELVGFVEDKIK